MNIQQYQYILAVAELRHFETAANSCFVSQSTLSTMIRRFEEETGIKIFDRKTKPVSITNEGEKMIQQIRIILKEIDSLDNIIQELKGEMIGDLKIGIIPTIAPYLIPLFLHSFASTFPKVKIIIQEMTTENIIKSLHQRILDIGIAALPLEDKLLKEYHLFFESFLLFDSVNKNKGGETILTDEVNYSQLLLMEEGHCLKDQVEQICKLSNNQLKSNLNFEFKAGSIDSLIRFSKANKGITLLPYLSTLDLNTKDRKHIFPFRSSVPVRSVGLVVHQNFVKKQILDQLQKIIKKAIYPILPNQSNENLIKPF